MKSVISHSKRLPAVRGIFHTSQVSQTHQLAARLARVVPAGTWLGLFGSLGSGKTTFMQGFARGLGIKTRIQSPTFTIIREYQGKRPLVHIDLYRLAGTDIALLGLEDYERTDTIVAVEWAEKLPPELTRRLVCVRCAIVDHSQRDISITWPRNRL